MSTPKEKEITTNPDSDTTSNSQVVEEKIIKVTGDVQIRKYYKGRLLGKGGFAKCYEFKCSENNKVFAAKVVAKSGLVKSRAKQKLISEIKFINHYIILKSSPLSIISKIPKMFISY